MRLPTESQLSREQKEVIAAPTEGTILVMGPPRKRKDRRGDAQGACPGEAPEQAALVVFNNVLTQYTGNDLTFQTWLNDWWKRATGAFFPAGYSYDTNGRRTWSQHHSKAIDMALGAKRTALTQRGHWGHLILDEAQDFPRQAPSPALSGATEGSSRI